MSSVSIQWRCPNMSKHYFYSDTKRLPVPCDECYSLRVTSEKIPYEPPSRWTEDDDK